MCADSEAAKCLESVVHELRAAEDATESPACIAERTEGSYSSIHTVGMVYPVYTVCVLATVLRLRTARPSSEQGHGYPESVLAS